MINTMDMKVIVINNYICASRDLFLLFDTRIEELPRLFTHLFPNMMPPKRQKKEKADTGNPTASQDV